MQVAPAALIALIATAAVFTGLVVAGVAQPFGVSALPGKACLSQETVLVDGTVYWDCTAALDWNTSLQGWNVFSVQQLAEVSFHGILFDVSGYNTMECPVVNVTGYEPNGASYAFLIFPTPMNCQFTQPTVLSPDALFGATWTGGASIQVLVRAG